MATGELSSAHSHHQTENAAFFRESLEDHLQPFWEVSPPSAHSDILIHMEIRATHQSVHCELLTLYKMSPFL